MDTLDCGALKVIALKKCGSTTMRQTFGERHFSQRSKGWGPDRRICYIRHPADRLVSAYNHFVGRDTVHDPCYGPTAPFDEWLDWWLASDLDKLDHHLRPQSYELWDALATVPPETALFLGLLSEACGTAGALSDWLKEPVGYPKNTPNHRHPPWQTYYTQAQLGKVRQRVRGCMWLWHVVREDGYQVIGGGNLSLQNQLAPIAPASN